MKMYLYLDSPDEDPPGFSVYGSALTHQYDSFFRPGGLSYVWHDAYYTSGYPFSVWATSPIYKQTKALYGEVLWGWE